MSDLPSIRTSTGHLATNKNVVQCYTSHCAMSICKEPKFGIVLKRTTLFDFAWVFIDLSSVVHPPPPSPLLAHGALVGWLGFLEGGGIGALSGCLDAPALAQDVLVSGSCELPDDFWAHGAAVAPGSPRGVESAHGARVLWDGAPVDILF